MSPLQECTGRVLETLRNDLDGGSWVLLDDGSADVISSTTSLELLTAFGAVSVTPLGATTIARDISAAAALAGGKLSCVIAFVSTLLGQAEDALAAACVSATPYTQRLVIACSISQEAHHDERPSSYSPSCYADFASRIRHRVASTLPNGPPMLDVQVRFVPLVVIPISDASFVLPAAGAAPSAAMAGGYPLGYGGVVAAIDSDGEDDQDEEDSSNKGISGYNLKPQGVAVLAHALAHVAAALNVRPEAFCLGPAARAVGRSMSFVPPVTSPGAQEPPTTPAAFILVDRAADILTPVVHADLLVQRMIDALRPISTGKQQQSHNGSAPAFSTAQLLVPLLQPTPSAAREEGVCVPGEERSLRNTSSQEGSYLPGSFFHPNDSQAAGNLGFLLTRRGRDAGMFVRKWLREAARKEGVQVTGRFKPGSVTAQELQALATAIATAPGATRRHSSLLQLAAAAVAALSETNAHQWEASLRSEQALILACGEGSDPACEQLIDILGAAGRGGGGIGLAEATAHILLAYCLVPDYLPWFNGSLEERVAFTAEQEAQLRGALADAVLACSARWASQKHPEAAAEHDAPWLPSDLRARLIAQAENALEEQGDDRDISNGAERRALLLEIRDAADKLFVRLRSLSQFSRIEGGARASPDQPTSLLVRLTDACIGQSPIQGLTHAGTSLAGLLKSGLGRIGLQRKHHPGDYGIVVIFVIGGVSVAEAHEVLAAADAAAAGALAAQAQAQAAEEIGGEVPGISGMPRRAPPKIIVGGSALLQPYDIVAHALADR